MHGESIVHRGFQRSRERETDGPAKKGAQRRALSAREGIEVTLNRVTKSNWHEATVCVPPRDGPLPKTAA
jgi:hypothetical protein